MGSLNLDGSSHDDRSLVVERADFEAAIAALRQAARAPREYALAIVTIVGAVGVWLAGIGSDGTNILVCLAAGWAIMLGGNVMAFRRHRGRVEKYGLACLTCRQPLIEAVEWRGRLARADAVLATRRCPACGTECFAAEV